MTYLDYIRTLPCACCGGQGSEAHHAIGIGLDRGLALKVHDLFAMPLCPLCHRGIHQGRYTHLQAQWILRTQERALRDGLINIGISEHE